MLGGGAGGGGAGGGAGAAAAVNAPGGVGGSRIELLSLQPSRPWREGPSRMARLIYEERIVALVGPTDGASAHVAAQVATRKRIPVLTLSAESSLTRALDPWVFRGLPDDAAQARALLRWALPEPGGARAAAVVPHGRVGRERLAALQEACDDLGVELTQVVRYGDGPRGAGEAGAPSLPADLDALLLWLDPAPALAFSRGLSRDRFPRHLLGSLRLDHPDFLAGAAVHLEGLAVPRLHGAPDAGPDLEARLGYDMIRALARAVDRFGPGPAAIRQGLTQLELFDGRSGAFRFDDRGNRRGAIPIHVLRGGAWVADAGHAAPRPPQASRGLPRGE